MKTVNLEGQKIDISPENYLIDKKSLEKMSEAWNTINIKLSEKKDYLSEYDFPHILSAIRTDLQSVSRKENLHELCQNIFPIAIRMFLGAYPFMLFDIKPIKNIPEKHHTLIYDYSYLLKRVSIQMSTIEGDNKKDKLDKQADFLEEESSNINSTIINLLWKRIIDISKNNIPESWTPFYFEGYKLYDLIKSMERAFKKLSNDKSVILKLRGVPPTPEKGEEIMEEELSKYVNHLNIKREVSNSDKFNVFGITSDQNNKPNLYLESNMFMRDNNGSKDLTASMYFTY